MTENLELDGQIGEIRAVWKLSFLVPSLHHGAHGPTLHSLDGDRSEDKQRRHVKPLNFCWPMIFLYRQNENRDFNQLVHMTRNVLRGGWETKEGGKRWEAERKVAGKTMGFGRGKRWKAEFLKRREWHGKRGKIVRKAKTPFALTCTLLSDPLLKIYEESHL